MAGRAVTQHGLQSPEPSLGPDPKRNAADAQRAANETSEEEPHFEDEQKILPTEEQKQAVEAVLNAGKKARVLLGIREKSEYGSPDEEKAEILKAVRKVGMLTHNRYNSHPEAEKAFKSK
jgi:hypothetical protein